MATIDELLTMAYQYLFEEGLEISLVPIEEAAPLTAGAKVLELGLNGFTGRVIVTKQASQQQYIPGRSVLNNSRVGKGGVDDDDDESSSSSEDIPTRRQANHAKSTQQTPSSSNSPKELKTSDLRSRSGQDPPSKKSLQENKTVSVEERAGKDSAIAIPKSREKVQIGSRDPSRDRSSSQKERASSTEGQDRSSSQRRKLSTTTQEADKVSPSQSGHRSSGRGKRRPRSRGRSATRQSTEKQLDDFATAFIAKPSKRKELKAEDISIDGSSVEVMSVGSSVTTPTTTKKTATEKVSTNRIPLNITKKNNTSDKQPAYESRVGGEEKSKGGTSTKEKSAKPTSGDPLRQFTTAMSTLSEKHSRKMPNPADTIDENSASSVSESTPNGRDNNPAGPLNHFPSNAAISTRGKFREKLEENTMTNDKKKPSLSMPRMSWSKKAPEPPSGGSPSHGQQRKVPTTGENNMPRLSPERKQQILDMFPGYPDNRIGESGSLDPVGAFLRKKCAEPLEGTIGAKHLAEMLEVFPYSAFCVDDKGRLPIHILADNGVLLKDLNGRKRAGKLAQLLMQAYPESVACPDSFGRIPFVALLERWVSAQSIRTGDETEEPPSSLWPQAEWCLSMMSKLLDDMVGTGLLETTFEPLSWEDRLAARHQYVLALLHCVPDLIKIVILIGGGVGKTRKRVERMSIIRRALLCPESLGRWLQGMVKKYGTSSKIAIDYFLLLSQTKPEDYVGPKRKPTQQDVEAFYDEREKVYRAIERLKVKIPKEEVERRASEVKRTKC